MKLFGKGGKFNIIDIIVVLILVAAIVFAVMHFVDKKQEAKEEEVSEAEAVNLTEPNLRFTVFFNDIPEDMADSIVASFDGEPLHTDKWGEMLPTRMFNAWLLLDAQAVDWETGPGEDPGEEDLWITCEAHAKFKEENCKVGAQEVRIGRTYIFKTLLVEATGIVSDMEVLGE